MTVSPGPPDARHGRCPGRRLWRPPRGRAPERGRGRLDARPHGRGPDARHRPGRPGPGPRHRGPQADVPDRVRAPRRLAERAARRRRRRFPRRHRAAARLPGRGRPGPCRRRGRQLTVAERARVRMDTAVAAIRSREAVDRLVSVSGASAFALAGPLQRIWRDLGREIYGRSLPGVEAQPTFIV
nr:hypothetical protein [Streptomyces sp. Ag109_O5-1]